MYTVKNVVSFEGTEGLGFNCSLYRDNKKVADVKDMADGGEMYYYFTTPEEEKLFKAQHDDIFMASLVDDYEARAWLLKETKNKVLFYTKEDELSFKNDTKQYRVLKNVTQFNRPKALQMIKDKYELAFVATRDEHNKLLIIIS